MRVDTRLAGRLARCSKCGTRFRVPNLEKGKTPEGQTQPAPSPEISGSHSGSTETPIQKPDPQYPSGEAQNDSPDLPWPIVRVRRLGWGKKKEVACLRPDGISLLVTREPITDELVDGNKANPEGDRFIRIDREKIRSVRVKRVGFITASSLWARFVVETDEETHEFRVPDRESPHVLQALQQIVGDRFRERPSRQPSGGELGLAVLAATSIALVAIAGLPAGTFGVIGLIFVVLAIAALRRDQSRSEYRLDHPSPPLRRRRQASGRRPFRSLILGWGSKIAGLTYLMCVLLFWNVKLDQHFSFNWLGMFVLISPGLVALTIGYRFACTPLSPGSIPTRGPRYCSCGPSTTMAKGHFSRSAC